MPAVQPIYGAVTNKKRNRHYDQALTLTSDHEAQSVSRLRPRDLSKICTNTFFRFNTVRALRRARGIYFHAEE